MPPYSEFEEEEFQAQVTTKTIRRIAGLAKPHWKYALGFISAIALVSVIDSYLTFLSRHVIDAGIIAGNKQEAIDTLLQYGGLILVQAVFVLVFIYLVGLLGEKVRYDLRKRLFNHLQKLSLSYFSRTAVGWIMARVTSDTDRVADLMTWAMLDIVWASVNIVTATYFMLIINWKMALIVFAALPILIVVAIRFRKTILVNYRQVRKMNSRITGSFNENITGVRVVKALSREDENLNEFSVLTNQMYNASYKAAWMSALFMPTVQVISAVALGIVLWLGGRQVQLGSMTIGGIQAFISYITFIMWPIQDLARIYAELQHAVASAERIFSLEDTIPEVQNKPETVAISTLQGDIVFENVDFYYEADKPVLKDFNLSIKHGETIALVGPTGGGKTTIVNLLCRFYEPRVGKVYINGQDYTDLRLEDIQSRIGIVLQTPHLFSGTIRDNIRYGRLEAVDEEVEQAARIAGAHDFIITLEKGYDQEVGEGGNLLSVGQKQLISLARAVLANPEIFIMDEATSSVDTLTEALIQQGMDSLMKGRTSFIIAHRLSTIKRADKILVIENGSISEMGSHTELLNLGGHYYRLYTQQFRRQLESEYDYFKEEEPSQAIA